MAGVSSWKKGHFASLAPHTQVAEHPWIKAKFQEIFLDFFIHCNFRTGASEINSFVLIKLVYSCIVRDSLLFFFLKNCN